MLPNPHQICPGGRKQGSQPSWSPAASGLAEALQKMAWKGVRTDTCGLQGFRSAIGSPLRSGLNSRWKGRIKKPVQELGSLFPASPQDLPLLHTSRLSRGISCSLITARSRVSWIFTPQMNWYLSYTSNGISILAQPRFTLTCPSAEIHLTDQASLAHLVRDAFSITSKVVSKPLSVSHPLANTDQPP